MGPCLECHALANARQLGRGWGSAVAIHERGSEGRRGPLYADAVPRCSGACRTRDPSSSDSWICPAGPRNAPQALGTVIAWARSAGAYPSVSIDIYWPHSIDTYSIHNSAHPPTTATMKQPHPFLLAALFACSLVLMARAAEPEPNHASPSEMEEGGTGVRENASLHRWRKKAVTSCSTRAARR